VVTRGSSGIESATAKRFVEEGADVFIMGRRQNELDGAVNHFGQNVAGVRGDVSELADIDKWETRFNGTCAGSPRDRFFEAPANLAFSR
jgi:NADP-dependent 3-hydroxy acid dehydrogenase YdfG